MNASTFRIAIASLALTTLATHARAATEDIGTATAITTTVTGTRDASAATLKSGDAVFQNETITTDANGVGQFQFNDQTKLAIGPASTIVLDNFVYDSNTSEGKVVINLTAGALRFITGKADHNAYEIVTPTATIGVRGTVFDVYTKDDGEMAVAMIEGAIEVCPKVGACRLHNVVGKFLHMTPLGAFSLRDTWDGSFLTGVPFKLALPFLGDQKNLVPGLRGSTTSIRKYVTVAGNDIGKAIKTPLTKLPRIKLPKLFGK
ncbi:MAG TPA: FecR domain-containing protein [Bauldia sp.]|nr:FecR domain-containing protein [Bauldia sp.]